MVYVRFKLNAQQGEKCCSETADSVDIETKRMYLRIALLVLQPEPELSDNCFITEGCSRIPLEKLHQSLSFKENTILHMKRPQRARTFSSSDSLHLFAVPFAGCRESSLLGTGSRSIYPSRSNSILLQNERPMKQLRKKYKRKRLLFSFSSVDINIICHYGLK